MLGIICIPGKIHLGQKRRTRQKVVQFGGWAEIFLGGQARLGDDRILSHLLSKQGRRIRCQFFRGIFARPQCGRGSYRTQLPLGHVQLQFQAADEVGHIGSLGPIVSVHFIQHKKLEEVRLCFISFPKLGKSMLHQPVIEHLEVGQQNVWGIRHNGVAAFNHMVFAHQRGQRVNTAVPNEQPCRDLALESCILMDDFGQSLGLVRSKCVHGVHDDALDARALVLLQAIVENGVQKGLRLS